MNIPADFLKDSKKDVYSYEPHRKSIDSEYFDVFHVEDLDRLFGAKVHLLEKEDRMKEITDAIEKSKYMLNLENDWNGEGTTACDYITWERTVNFLKKIAIIANNSFNTVIDAPKISYGVDGSIDMFWKTPKYKLLVAFPKNETDIIPFFGKTTDNETMEGTFNLDGGKALMMLLIGQKNV